MRFLPLSILALAAACSTNQVQTSSAPTITSAGYVRQLDVPEPAPPAPPAPKPKRRAPEMAPLPDSLPTSLPTSFPNAPAAAVQRSGKTWPFHAWDRAEAVVTNWFPYGRDSAMRAYDENGWSPWIVYRTGIDVAVAKRAASLVTRQGGELLVTKCPNPRHAIILFDGDTPVASINVDLVCRDVLVWPEWTAKPAPVQMQLAPKLAEEFLPRWRGVFFDELHLPQWDPANGH